MPRRNLREDLLAIGQTAPGDCFTLGDAARVLGLTPRDAMRRLDALRRGGWVRRIKRGLYRLDGPDRDPLHAVGQERDQVLAASLFWPAYIGGWSAAEYHRLPAIRSKTVFVVTPARVRRTEFEVAGVKVHAARVSPHYFEGPGIDEPDSTPPSYSSLERTIVDALHHPKWLGGVRHLADALRALCFSHRWSADRLAEILEEIGSGAAIKRLDALSRIEDLHALGPVIDALWSRRTKGIVDLEPGAGKSGIVLYPARVRLNVDLDPPEEEEEPEPM